MIVLAIGDLGFTGPLNIGLTLLAGERDWGAAGLGWIVSGFGTGAATASPTLGWCNRDAWPMARRLSARSAGAENSSVQVSGVADDHVLPSASRESCTGIGMMICRAAALGLSHRDEHLLAHAVAAGE
jgi:hypothetical protein